MLIFTVNGQTIALQKEEKLVSDSVGFVRLQFLFSDDWKELVKVAQFTQKQFTGNILLDTDGIVELPKEIKPGNVSIGIFGVDGGVIRATTHPFTHYIYQSSFLSTMETPIPPTPDLYQQIISKFNEGADGASAYDIAVKNGFKGSQAEWVSSLRGEPGSPGPRGLQGPRGEKGEGGNLSQNEYDPRVIVSFTTDDGTTSDYTKFKPIFDSEGVPCCACAITSKIGTYGYMNADQLRALKAAGWSVASHTHDHINLSTLDEQAVEYQLKTSKDILKELDLETDIMVLPGGGTSPTVRRMLVKHYSASVYIGKGMADNSNRGYNIPPTMENHNIYRVFGMDGTEPNTLASLKALIDADLAANRGNWLIFEHHASNANWDSARLAELKALIQYVKSKNIPIVNYEDGFRMKRNLLESGDMEANNRYRVYANGLAATMDKSGPGRRESTIIVGSSLDGYAATDVDVLCDGENDSALIYSALNKTPGGGRVFCRKGTYIIKNPLILNKDNITLEGEGTATVFVRAFTNTSGNNGVISTGTSKSCVIKNIKVDGNNSVHSHTLHWGMLISGQGARVENCVLQNGLNGLRVTGEGSVITGNEITGVGGGEALYLTGAGNMSVTGNRCTNHGFGVTVSNSGHVIRGNSFVNNDTIAIRLYGAQSCIVEGNSLRDNAVHIRLQNTSVRNSVTGNNCLRGTGQSADYTSTQHTIQVYDAGSQYNLISGNLCAGKAPVNYTGEVTNVLANNLA